MAAAASGTLNMFSEYLSSRAIRRPFRSAQPCSASYIDWLKAISLMALGITTAMRTFCMAVGVAAGPAAAAVSRAISNNNNKQSVFHFLSPYLFIV